MHKGRTLKRFLLLLLLLSHFSCVRLCATPQMAAHQAPPFLGFSRQEHWSGLPFPSPMHESKKWKWRRSVVSNCWATPWTAACQAPLSMGFSRQECWSGLPLPSPKGSRQVLFQMWEELSVTDFVLHLSCLHREWTLQHYPSSFTIYLSLNSPPARIIYEQLF